MKSGDNHRMYLFVELKDGIRMTDYYRDYRHRKIEITNKMGRKRNRQGNQLLT